MDNLQKLNTNNLCIMNNDLISELRRIITILFLYGY